MKDGYEIQDKFEDMKKRFKEDPLSMEVTETFREIDGLCRDKLEGKKCKSLQSNATARGKHYVVVFCGGECSRPVNVDLYNEGQGLTDVFWDNVFSGTIANQSAHDITAALYAIAMNYCMCADILPGLKNNAGDYFEKLIGHLYAVHLNTAPSKKMNAVKLGGESIKLPTDFIFDLGEGEPKLHVPVKTSTRERAAEVWIQQAILERAFSGERILCLLTCISETNRKKEEVEITCVPEQWRLYQMFIARIRRAYYLDVPEKYQRLNYCSPTIHVKEFGEFFHEVHRRFD